MSFNLGYFGSLPRSQINTLLAHYRHISFLIGLEICQNVFLKSQDLILVTWGLKLSQWVKLKKYLLGIIEATFIAQWSRKLVRMFFVMKSQMSENFGHLYIIS